MTVGTPQGKRAHRCLGSDQELALVVVIGREACPGQQQKLWSELERHDRAHGRRIVMRELGQHQPVLGRALHPRSHVGDQRAAGP